jgi:diguanylate cyclase (GGDEF)-like protein/PAS domain S-box-containing protein
MNNKPQSPHRNLSIDALLTSKGPVLIGESCRALMRSEARYRLLINRMSALIMELSLTGEILYSNEVITQITGISVDELKGRDFTELLLIQESAAEMLHQQFLQKGELCAVRSGIRTHDNSRKIISWNSVNIYDSQGLIERIIYFGIDVTKQVAIEKELSIAAIAFESQEGMLITDAHNMILRVNRAFTAITGYTAEDVIGLNPRIFKSGHHDEAFYAAMWKSLSDTGVWAGEIWNRRKNGEISSEILTIAAVKNAAGIVTNYVSAFVDSSVINKALEEIKSLAFYDPLTGLPNRRLLVDRLEQSLLSSVRSGLEGVILFLDLDHFKTLNDTLGHDMGDLLLQQVAQRLTACVREGDTVARLGGDEFVIVLTALSEQKIEAAVQAEIIANEILISLNQIYQLNTHIYHCSSSIGVTMINNSEAGIEELLQQADIAMYQAKKAGRNRVCFFDPKMQATINANADLEGKLYKALEYSQFRLHYQIQVDNSGSSVGAEALIRWLHPELGLIFPIQFIPLAEETGLIRAIGQWVVETACAQLSAWQNQALTCNLTLSINVSAQQFQQSDFVAHLQASIEGHGINPGLLNLELTESIFLANMDETIASMNALRTLGVQFSLDDFGTGYSCLQYLKRLPLDQLKIDQSFVRDLIVDNSDRAIVSTIIAMAKSLELDVIAEGVETDEQRQFLQHKGCLHYQGYLFGKPLPIEQFEALLVSRTGHAAPSETFLRH